MSPFPSSGCSELLEASLPQRPLELGVLRDRGLDELGGELIHALHGEASELVPVSEGEAPRRLEDELRVLGAPLEGVDVRAEVRRLAPDPVSPLLVLGLAELEHDDEGLPLRVDRLD